MIPTDFTAASLQLMEETILVFKPEPVNIVLFHAFTMPQSMQDIVGADSKPHIQVINERFRKSCKRIKDKYSDYVHNIHYRHLYGDTLRVFKHYLQFNKIDCIVYPSNYFLQITHPRSVDPDRLIRKCGYPVITTLLRETSLNISNSIIDKNGDLFTPDLISNQ
jgi:hypothetical protein